MGRWVLTNATVLDGVSPAAPDTTITIEGDRITAVEQGAPGQPRPDDEVVDLAGRTLMPGMFTCHFHSTYHELGSTQSPFGFEHAPAYQTLLAARNLGTALRHGYTSVVSAGAANDIDPSLKRAIADGLIVGPRLVPGSRELSTTGHSNDTTPWYWNAGAAGAVRLCDGAESFRLGV